MDKYCPQCETVKELDEFAKHKNRPDGVQSICKDCQHKNAVTYYKKNSRKFTERNRQQRISKRQFIVDYLKDKACLDCGVANPVVLTFDHVKGKKVDAVANMVNRSFSIEAIKAEIQKCEIRCFNCHMIKDCQKRTTAAATIHQP